MLPLITNHFCDYGTICILMAISLIILIITTAYRARAIKNKAKDRQIALKAVADIEPELKGRDVEKMKITNSIFDNDVDSIYIEYEQGAFRKTKQCGACRDCLLSGKISSCRFIIRNRSMYFRKLATVILRFMVALFNRWVTLFLAVLVMSAAF